MMTRSQMKLSKNATFTVSDSKKKKKLVTFNRSIIFDRTNRVEKSKLRKHGFTKKSFKDQINEFLSIDFTTELLCRDHEISLIKKYFSDIINNDENKLLYVIGCPGTGKTAVVKSIIHGFEKKIKFYFLNCMNIENPLETIHHLNNKLTNSVNKHPKNIADCFNNFKSIIFKMQKKQKTVIIFDEIDRVMNVADEILYPLVDLLFNSNLVFSLIMISNSLDFNHQTLSHLKYRPNNSITSINFNAYTSSQIEIILKNRLDAFIDHIEPSAIEFCAKRVGALDGDIRKALAVMRAAVDRAIIIGKEDSSNNFNNIKVKVIDVMVACKPLFGIKTLNNDPSCKTSIILPLHQWLILLSIVLMCKEDNKHQRRVNIDLILRKYCNICIECNIESISVDEFHSVIGILETYSFIKRFSQKSKKDPAIELLTSIPEVIPILKNNKAVCLLHENLLKDLI